MNKIYISSIAFAKLQILEIINICKLNGLSLEFSSGIEYESDMFSIYYNCPIERIPHNYFPAPKEPFVINLASLDAGIREKSILHCINGLQLAAKSKSPFYAAHAGFCIDPDPNELGNKIRLKNDFDIKTHINIFIESILSLLIFARKFKVKFLIENNVITSQNLLHNSNPLLCCDSDQIISIFNEINDDNFGLLLDTAHLKVSAKTLENDLDCEYNKIKKYVKGLHHSDNDGFIDNNCKLSSNYWFLKYCKNHNDIPNVIEVKNLTIIEIKDHIKLLNNA